MTCPTLEFPTSPEVLPVMHVETYIAKISFPYHMPANKHFRIAKNVTRPAASSKAKKRAKATAKPVPKKSRKSHRSLDTYEMWLETQQKKRRTEVREVKASVMPVDTMSEWLRKQPVVERQQRGEVTHT